ncbi:MAG: carbohydrate binding family 9 domain-containing protein, partial [Chitinophagaceae bacterium]|nr:carbohydrate binding family 9 domain-containing protein [Chitinophagaceae bacterium]
MRLNPRPLFFRSYFLLLCLLAALTNCHSVRGQSGNDALFTAAIGRTDKPVKIDGLLDDEGWMGRPKITRFRQQFPFDTSLAVDQTEVMMAYDDDFLYIAATLYQKKFVVNSLRRDFPWGGSDIFIVLIDPFRDKLNGFYFSVTPYGVQKEALLSNGTDRNADWDQTWFTEATRYEDR